MGDGKWAEIWFVLIAWQWPEFQLRAVNVQEMVVFVWGLGLCTLGLSCGYIDVLIV